MVVLPVVLAVQWILSVETCIRELWVNMIYSFLAYIMSSMINPLLFESWLGYITSSHVSVSIDFTVIDVAPKVEKK